MSLVGMTGMVIKRNGVEIAGAQDRSIRIYHRGGSAGSASFVVEGGIGSVTVLEENDPITIEDREQGRLLFAGNVRNPAANAHRTDTWIRQQISCLGAFWRFEEKLISNADGIRIAKLATAGEQIAALVALRGTEGFTASVQLGADTVRLSEDMRYQSAASMLRRIAELNDAFLYTTPAKVVSVTKRSLLPAGPVRLDRQNATGSGYESDEKDVRTHQFVRFGAVVRRRTINGNGVRRSFDITGALEGVDFFADGVEARGSLSERGDFGLRFRDDAAAAVNGQNLDLFGGNAAATDQPLFLDDTEHAGSNLAMRLLATDDFQLDVLDRTEVTQRYAVAIRHSRSGDEWVIPSSAASGASVESVGARDASRDFNVIPSGRTGITPQGACLADGLLFVDDGYAGTAPLNDVAIIRAFTLSGNRMASRDMMVQHGLGRNSRASVAGMTAIGTTAYILSGHSLPAGINRIGRLYR